MNLGEPIYLEGMEECYVLRAPSDTRVESQWEPGDVILAEEEVALIPVKDGFASRARFLKGGCHSFLSKRSGTVV